MTEYIDRNRLKEAIQEDALNSLSSYNGDLLNLILIEIDEAPAADVIPAPVFRVGDRVKLYVHNDKSDVNILEISRVWLFEGDKWHYVVSKKDVFGIEDRYLGFSDDDVGVWVFHA